MFLRFFFCVDKNNQGEYQDLCRELTTMQHLGEHPNVVNLIGACTLDGDLNVILEFCSNGSLLMYLRSKKDNFDASWQKENGSDVDYSDLVTLALGAANGLAFLESKKVHISCDSLYKQSLTNLL